MAWMTGKSIWPKRGRDGVGEILPRIAGMVDRPRPYQTGKSRFAIAPMRLTLDQLLLLITAALLTFGLIMVQSADARLATFHSQGFKGLLNWFANKNMIHAGIALAAMVLVWRCDYRWLLGGGIKSSPAVWLIVVTAILLVGVFVPGLGKEVNGARRWVGVGSIQLQPSELAKLGMVLFISAYAAHLQAGIRGFWRGFVPLVAIFGVVALLVIKEDFGTTVLISMICFFMMFIAGCKWWHLGMLIPPGAVGVWVMLFRDKDSFRYKRLVAFMDPFAEPKGAGYHLIQSLLTIMNGGIWGRGLGNGIQKMGYLPEDNTDFIFAVICEELGWVGAFMVLSLFALFVVVGWRISARCSNIFGRMIAFGITSVIGIQAAMNVAVVTASMPTKGIALPMISSGGTGWIMMAIAVGILMSVERVNRKEEWERGPRIDEPKSWGFPILTAKSNRLMGGSSGGSAV